MQNFLKIIKVIIHIFAYFAKLHRQKDIDVTS